MAATAETLRTNFPEFKNVDRYPEGLLTFWLTFAYSMLNAARWGSQLDMAAQLWAAHEVVLERKAIDEATDDDGLGLPGLTTGVISADSVDKASTSYDTTSALDPDSGYWNLTIYGLRMARLISIFGMGPVVVGVGCTPPFSISAWAGPPFWPGWFGNT